MAEPIEPPITVSQQAAADLEAYNSAKVSLAEYCAKGTAEYAQKRYEDAVDHYAQASELQAEINGEMAPENAEILFLYGRALFKVAQQQSDVLGGRAGGEKQKPKKKNGGKKVDTIEEEDETVKLEVEKKDETVKTKAEEKADEVAEEAVAIIANGGATKKEDSASTDPKKPLFTFTGDENFEDSDEEEEADGEDDEEEDDPLNLAFDILDLARVLFEKRLQADEGEGKGKGTGDTAMTTHIKERLADTRDLLGEISLENERFPAAVSDFRESLALKESLFPEEDEQIAEAHYKLSLALEFASITHTETDEKKPNAGAENVDEEMRAEAVKELELAIKSTKLKLHNQEVELAETAVAEDNDVTRHRIADVKSIVADMELRLKELRAPPVDINQAVAAALAPAGAPQSNAISGILGNILGESASDTAARVEEAKKTATDLTGLVRHKKKEIKDLPIQAGSKRKAEEEPEAEGESSDGGKEKKAKVANTEDNGEEAT
ncbi:hypothetical protein sscle_08g065020 [Sclerotinia sclerotiorum 1980 UF-70]|uniref:Tetratricopeptide SHNi-TPR domain-containing protein n=1 Tax=Sclerotinia sclerotiorum (strain ATCC 18683 / 1980 / Ss-1) TaxID=665079 RepID=A0A1D9QAE2_SCLS1|nr:hypothetical protein sscle_08g065020 [Sclerotinia sclerotiorum 1980 UF-70]